MNNKRTIKAIEDFLIVKSDRIRNASLIFIFGGTDLKLSDVASCIFEEDYGKYILISVGENKESYN